jgi:DNA polymerase-3 subunit gamma/tau
MPGAGVRLARALSATGTFPMTYLALARKWRPRTFADVAGQTHVVRALENALGSGRVHHAFLFTGTRGVGKTTIARIFVKALNCEKGVSASPCGECNSCRAIDEGRFVDFLELDAASRTGVDDTRELLENTQYTPAAGRFKVYLIDEVHMLSKSAFNALLKTLEEPPAHVKFLLATTDPQKIPVTVLSRCLQFNLKRLPQTLIAERLAAICRAEGIEAQPGALERLARAGAGSMRDALSLLDQALAYGNGRLTDTDVAQMLGSLDRSRVLGLLDCLAGGDAGEVLRAVRELDELSPDYEDVLSSLAGHLEKVAVVQLAGPEAAGDDEDGAALQGLAARLAPELVQLMYQIAVTGRRDLSLAPDLRTGFEMTLLRMLAFRPDGPESAAASAPGSGATAGAGAGTRPRPSPAAAPAASPSSGPSSAPLSGAAASAREAPGDGARPLAAAEDIRDWPAFVTTLTLDGAVRQLAANCALESASPFELRLVVEPRNSHLLTEQLKARLTAAVQERAGPALKVVFSLGQPPGETIADLEARNEAREQQEARDRIASDPNVRQLQELLGAEVVPESIKRVARKGRTDR